ncbi:MAG: phenylalanine--tRNA ligase subunit beta [Syntrophales bacterium]|nr:phenylalanine--tRNA ligase subunit beta [Syntrophales bacterium]
MLLSIRWLRDYVDIELAPGELAGLLTMAGLEVDAIRDTSPSFTGTVVAKIISIKPHPKADRLSLCEVSTGKDIYPVVCGAGNIHPGDVVPMAMVGAVMPDGLNIKRSLIRGEASEGMLCCEKELGIGEDETGIMILPPDLIPGSDLIAALGLKDTVFDISITPNRADCLSVIGLAREVAAITGVKLRYPRIAISEEGEDIRRLTSVDILDPDLCQRYSARVIRNVKIKPSPLWMRMRLDAAGLRVINNIVDVTNFVMMESGQPLHAFDYHLLEEGRIVVRRSRQGEIFTSLDGKEHRLPSDTALICDGVKPVAIGGIMGGLNSEVRENTETVLLESAYFNPTSIRRSAKNTGMATESSFRFERGVDSGGVIKALDRAAQLIADISGGQICKNYIDQYPQKMETPHISLRRKRVNEVLGTAVDTQEMIRIIESLEMDVDKMDAEGDICRVTPPTFRVDITREIDIIEEIARIHGYDRIPAKLPTVPVMPVIKTRKNTLEDRIREILGGHGYSEVINYSFISPESLDLLAFREDDERRQLVRIKNPISEDQSVMRTTLVYSLLKTYEKNIRTGCFNLKIFEIGRVFLRRNESGLPVEKNHLGCLLAGLRHDDLWHFKLPADFYDLKGCVEDIFDNLRISDVKFRSDNPETFLHPGRSCRIYAADQFAGVMGEVHPDVLAGLDMKNRAMVFELDLDVLAASFSDRILYREVSRFPSTWRDVAFLVPAAIEANEIIAAALGGGKELLEKVNIFDIYTGQGIPERMKSLGLRFSYRSDNRTLTDIEVNQVHGEIVQRIVALTGAKIRGEESQILMRNQEIEGGEKKK